jgi:hypothetical protein
MLLIMKSYTSSYQIWNLIAKNPDLDPNLDVKLMAYNNVNKRILKLHQNGYLEIVKRQNKTNTHKRKDYGVTKKGIEQLIPYLLTHPKEAEIVTKYVNKLDTMKKHILGNLLIDKIVSTLDFANQYLGSIGRLDFVPLSNLNQIKPIQYLMTRLNERLLDIEDRIRIEESKQVTIRGSQKFTTMKIRDGHYNEFAEQQQSLLERGLNSQPEIAHEDYEDVVRNAKDAYDSHGVVKAKSTRHNPIPTNRSRSKTIASQQKKKH